MKNRLVILLAAIGLVIAGAPSADAGGTGSFYHHWVCRPHYNTADYLEVTNYPIKTGQRYHIHVHVASGSVNYVYFNSTRLGTGTEYYVDRVSKTSTNKIAASWFYGPYLLATTTECSITG